MSQFVSTEVYKWDTGFISMSMNIYSGQWTCGMLAVETVEMLIIFRRPERSAKPMHDIKRIPLNMNLP